MSNGLKAFFSGLSEKEKKILYVAITFVIFASLDRLIFSPISQLSENIENGIVTQTNNIKKNFSVLGYKNKILKEEKDYSIFFVSNESTSEELIADFLSEVEHFAQESGVQLTNINPVSVEEKTNLIQYDLLLECAGKMSEIVNFIYAIDGANKPIRVVAWQLIPKDRREYSVKSMVTIRKILVYPYGVERITISAKVKKG